MKTFEGYSFDENHYNTIINDSIDVFREDGTLLLSFHKNVLPNHYNNTIADNLRKIAIKKHNNRGASAGILDWRKISNYVKEFIEPKVFRTKYEAKSGKPSKRSISNLAPSNIIGYFDKRDINKPKSNPCRMTAFTKNNIENWNNTLPFFKHIDCLFKQFIPDRHENQLTRARLKPKYQIEDTSFTTVTVNYSWRTSCHKDKGDYEDGFGNLIVIEDERNPNTYEGCYIGFPQYGICVNVRKGDFLGMDVHEYHCNTEFKPVYDKLIPFNKFTEMDYINEWCFNRMSIVCYLRKNMIKCID